MVADHLPPKRHPKALGRNVFAVTGGTSALNKTVNCEVNTAVGAVMLSIPDVLGALVLKGAAYVEDSRDRERHIDDAAILACALTDPVADRTRMAGSDQRRIASWEGLTESRPSVMDIHRDKLATRPRRTAGARRRLTIEAGDLGPIWDHTFCALLNDLHVYARSADLE